MKPKVKDEASILMWEQIRELRYTICDIEKEFRFEKNRRWRSDFKIVAGKGEVSRLLIEIEGGAWIQGRHTRGSGFVKDLEKYNYASLMGWRVLRFTPQQVLDGSAIAFIKRVLES